MHKTDVDRVSTTDHRNGSHWLSHKNICTNNPLICSALTQCDINIPAYLLHDFCHFGHYADFVTWAYFSAKETSKSNIHSFVSALSHSLEI